MIRFALTIGTLLIVNLLWGQSPAKYPFQNPELSVEERVEDLISQLTLEEKVGQLLFKAPAIPRLGIREYNWWNECLHGLARNGRATVFPQAIGLGATFDPDLMHRMGEAIALEARAKYNANKKVGYMGRYAGLTFWSPNVNLFRDPRWGRGQETYGEDPYLISRLGVSFVKGLQGEGEQLKVAAMAKHFAVHSGPEKLRHEFDAQVSRHDLWNTYLPAFEALVTEANVEGIMGAYNRTNGAPCNAHPYLMQEVLRKKWGFDGYFVSDCWALVDFVAGHKVSETPAEAAAMALNAGCNLNCGATYPELLTSVKEGLTTEEEIDANLRMLLPTLFQLGIFDPEGSGPYDDISTEVVRAESHLELAYEAALKSVVLLKNEENTLPLSPDVRSLFVTGPMAADGQALLANYYGVSDNMTTLLEGIVGNVSDHTAIRYVQGSIMDRPNVNPVDWYSEEAQVADVTIACMGISQLMEGEEGEAILSPNLGDRDAINLPEHQIEFLRLIRKKAAGKKLIVVLTGGSAISSPEVHELADAVVYAWYPGEQGGQAVGDLIFGKASPSGKLPVTFVERLEDLPPYEDYNMQNRTYRYLQKTPLYPFGFGLTYADVEIGSPVVDHTRLKKGQKLSLSLEIENLSEVSTEEVIQVYVRKTERSEREAQMSLKAFKRIALPAKRATTVTFDMDQTHFMVYDEEGNQVLEPGTYEVMIGTSTPFARSTELGAPEWQTVEVELR